MGSDLAKETAGDRVYYAVKASAIAYEFRQGRRIYMEPIAERLGVSTTPVREALNRLAAEGLVIKAPRKGFIALTLNAEKLLGHYELTKLLLMHELEALDQRARGRLSRYEPIANILFKLNRSQISNAGTLAGYTGLIFRELASLGGNRHVIRSIDRANDHLYYIRTIECTQFQDIRAQLIGMCEMLLGCHCEELLKTLERYHDTRMELLPDMLELATARAR